MDKVRKPESQVHRIKGQRRTEIKEDADEVLPTSQQEALYSVPWSESEETHVEIRVQCTVLSPLPSLSN